jgi:hypothetical protein
MAQSIIQPVSTVVVAVVAVLTQLRLLLLLCHHPAALAVTAAARTLVAALACTAAALVHLADEVMAACGRVVAGVAATLAHLLMSVPELNYFIFTFPAVLMVLVGFMLAMGRYRGYRLTELFRFKAFLKD